MEVGFNSASKHIQDSVVVQMKNIFNTFKSPENDEFKADLPNELLESATQASNLSPEQPLYDQLLDINHIEKLWEHQTIKDAYKNRTNLGIADSAPHFLDDLDRIKDRYYRPTPEDILLAPIPTTGMARQYT